MANTQLKIERVEFILKEEITICNLFYSSNEPGTPWGGGWKTKTFPASKSAIEILAEDANNFIMWINGREGNK